jgi:NodT family efflux transporter outer membrane factor (OMF) lipoprotein
MQIHQLIKYSLIGTFVVLLSACSVVGPNYKKPQEQKFPDSWDTNLSKSEEKIKEWWRYFHDETLNTLVKKTYEQNLDLRSASLRILQARAALGIAQGLQYPQVQTLSGSLAGVRAKGATFSNIGASFDVGWEMDVWGKYARGIESSEATLYASIASYDDILITLISEVARSYINYTIAQERIAFATRNIKIQERVTTMTQVQFNAGNVSELDMQQAKTQLYATKSLLPSMKLLKIQSRNALAILLGVLPDEIDKILTKQKVNGYNYIPEISISESFQVDADLIRRRPDIKVAELQAQAQNARIGMAQADLYPHFSLFGTLGYNTNDATGNWVSAGDAVGISAGPAFSWNIFQYDRIKNQVRIQDALFQESLINYNKKVLQAVGEVSNALNGYKLTKEQLEFNAQAIDATKRAYSLSVTQYENGLVTYQRLLSTVESLTKNEDAYAQIKGSIALQVISLYKALGGSFAMQKDRYNLHKEDLDALKERKVDWGEYLEQKND